MKHFVALAALVAATQPARAAPIVLKPMVDMRVRYEHDTQEGLSRASNALTARLRGGLAATSGAWSALVEGQGTVALIGHYYDGLRGPADRPLIADPENVALYRAQIEYRTRTLIMTAGRQRIALDDERFVGAVAFRQAGQTFDAARVEWSPMPKLKADLSYAWSVRTIWGIDGRGARQQAVSGDNVLANVRYTTPIGAITGFAYLVDQDEAAVQAFRQSSQTYGIRLAGARPLSPHVKLSYQASFATQSDYHRNPNAYRASYYLIDGTLDLAAFKLGGGYEVLGADKGAALTSFQTPLGTLFKFQGWADKFLTTPPNGLRDLYASLGYGVKQVGPAKGVTLQATYHRFESDRLNQHYGNEIDLLASGKIGRTGISVRFADYMADQLFTDSRKVWLQLDWILLKFAAVQNNHLRQALIRVIFYHRAKTPCI